MLCAEENKTDHLTASLCRGAARKGPDVHGHIPLHGESSGPHEYRPSPAGTNGAAADRV